MAKISSNSITALVIGVVMIVVLFNVMVSVVPLGTTAVHNLSDALVGQSATIGTGPATFAGQIDELSGWFWVVGPLVLVLGLVIGLFLKKGRR